MGMLPFIHGGTPWGFTAAEIPNLEGEIFMVTGGNTGLGYWTAVHLASKNGTVIIACRNEGKCNEAAERIRSKAGHGVVETLSLDLSSFASIRAAAEIFKAKHAALDGLILNAGVMVPPFGLTVDGLETQIGTNHFGHFLLTKLMMPGLEAAVTTRGVATVVAVSSAGHYDSYPEGIRDSIESINDESSYDRVKAYGQSKLANVLFTQELAERFRDKGILANSVHPGGVDTSLFRHVWEMVGRYSTTVAKFLEDYALRSVVWHPRDASLTTLFVAVGPQVRQDKIAGRYFHPIARMTTPDLHASNETLQKHLWAVTEAFVDTH